MIICSAVRLKDGSVFVGKRHGDAYTNALKLLKANEDDMNLLDSLFAGSEFGFITDGLVYLDRYDSFDEAVKCKQVSSDLASMENFTKLNKIFRLVVRDDEQSIKRIPLISEDLWPEPMEKK